MNVWARSGRKRRTSRRDPLTVSLLKKDHRQVEDWFDEYEQLEADRESWSCSTRLRWL